MKNDIKKEEHKQRFTLVILVAAFIFAVQLIAVLVAAVLVYVLLRAGIITEHGAASPNSVIFFMALISVFIGVIVTALGSKISLKPINRMISQMNRLASGDFKARLTFGKPIGAHPAFVEISNSFNKMAEELEGTEMLRSDFINNFSHEFKTPIVSIAGFAKLLKRGNLTEQQKAEYLNIIEEESLRLSAMATNVLNMTKVENQTILTDITRYNLSEQLRSCILLLEAKWSKKNIEFGIEFGEYMIQANEELLKQVWINLIDNAIKFSPEGSTVILDVKEQSDSLSVSVLNSGSEITPEQQKRIFNKFYQADESHSSEGNGIGLALVKRITDLHSGSISVRSLHNTTVFTVELPKTQSV